MLSKPRTQQTLRRSFSNRPTAPTPLTWQIQASRATIPGEPGRPRPRFRPYQRSRTASQTACPVLPSFASAHRMGRATALESGGFQASAIFTPHSGVPSTKRASQLQPPAEPVGVGWHAACFRTLRGAGGAAWANGFRSAQCSIISPVRNERPGRRVVGRGSCPGIGCRRSTRWSKRGWHAWLTTGRTMGRLRSESRATSCLAAAHLGALGAHHPPCAPTLRRLDRLLP